MRAAGPSTHLTVLAKSPVPGRVKTRLGPTLSPTQAADVALACLRDTLDAALRCSADRVVLALDGSPGAWVPADVAVVDQGTGTLTERLATTWETVGAPGLQIGMDTPQVSAALLDESLQRLAHPSVDAVLGPACDGGWWAIGMAIPVAGAFDGVPTGRSDTGERQHKRLVELGLRVERLPELRDVDDIDDARAVAILAPRTRLARTITELGLL